YLLIFFNSIPNTVPMSFNLTFMFVVSLGLILMAILGSLIPIRIVLKVDPVSVIGG
ncbi:ABC transporter permease, partial [Lactobacillus salivarius]|nr:ABC transporter permease [Ligilactobacillus salivarius]